MTDHEFPFVHTLLEARLQNHLKDALRFVSTLSEEDVLQCDNACLTEIIRQFAVAAPVLRTDIMETDKRIIESTDLVSEQTTGHSLHSVFVPVEREARWLEEVDRQTAPDGKPLAFLDRERNRIVMRLVVAPEDGEGTLKRKVDDRKSPLEQYGASVTEKIIDFNKELTARMAAALEGRKTTIAKGRTEQEKVGLPQVHSPEHEEMVLLIERIQKNLGGYVKAPSADSRVAEVGEVRTFIVHGHDHKALLS